jgi:hypothetical protein
MQYRDPVRNAARMRRWRATEKGRDMFYAQKRKNYAQTRAGARNRKTVWTCEEDAVITAAARPTDRVLAGQLGRSVQAIQVRRCKLQKGESDV